ELGGGGEESAHQPGIRPGDTVERPRRPGRLSQPPNAAGDVTIAGPCELLGEAVAGGRELLERKAIELVGFVWEQGGVHDMPSVPRVGSPTASSSPWMRSGLPVGTRRWTAWRLSPQARSSAREITPHCSAPSPPPERRLRHSDDVGVDARRGGVGAWPEGGRRP